MLQRLLETAARKGTQAEFARAISCCAELGMKTDVTNFVKLLLAMCQRGTPQVMLRMALNMAMPKGAPVVSLLPPDLDDEEERQAFEDGEPLPDEKKEKEEKGKDKA